MSMYNGVWDGGIILIVAFMFVLGTVRAMVSVDETSIQAASLKNVHPLLRSQKFSSRSPSLLWNS